MKIDTLILAGGKNNGKFEKYSSKSYEAFIEINNIPMVKYIVSAVKEASSTSRIAIVGPGKKLENFEGGSEIDIVIEASDSIVDNIEKGINNLSGDYILIMTSDIPLVTGKMIDDFIDYSQQKNADLYFPIISKEKNLDKFPDIKRTYVKLVEGTFTAGNIVLVKPEVLNESLELLQKVMLCRKKPWKLCTLLGLKFIFKLLFGKLKLKDIEDRVAEITGYKSLGLIIEYPEIGFDIDKPQDLKVINKYVS